jgi:hypothetical protein
MTKKVYNQSGGWLAEVGQFLVGIVGEIIKQICEFCKWAFKFKPKEHTEEWGWWDWVQLTKNWEYGSLWIYIWWCFKVTIYLIIFCFGGPIVILAGIIYLYSKLGTKLTDRAKSTNSTNSTNI